MTTQPVTPLRKTQVQHRIYGTYGSEWRNRVLVFDVARRSAGRGGAPWLVRLSESIRNSSGRPGTTRPHSREPVAQDEAAALALDGGLDEVVEVADDVLLFELQYSAKIRESLASRR